MILPRLSGSEKESSTYEMLISSPFAISRIEETRIGPQREFTAFHVAEGLQSWLNMLSQVSKSAPPSIIEEIPKDEPE